MRPDIKPGATFPDYVQGVPRRLSELQGDGPKLAVAYTRIATTPPTPSAA
jgi:hypothetical protein